MRMSIDNQELVNFLTQDLEIPLASLEVGRRNCRELSDPLPMVLWQYGLVSLNQLEQIFDWLDK